MPERVSRAPPTCDDLRITLLVRYKDAAGNAQSASLSTFNSDTSSVTLSNAYTPATGTVTNELVDCNPNMSATCTFSVTTAPK